MTFDEWLNEIENFSSREERLLEDIANPNTKMMLEWLKAAYIVGYEEGKKDGSKQS